MIGVADTRGRRRQKSEMAFSSISGRVSGAALNHARATTPVALHTFKIHMRHFLSHLAHQVGLSPETEQPSSSEDDSADDERRTGIYNFLQVPWNLEPLLILGYLTCLDSFLQLITFMPLRVIGALINSARGRTLTPSQQCSVLRAVLIVSVSLVLLRVDMSQTYHMVRNQAMLKLYVIFNLLEVFDKLCASFGQDILDSLDSAATSRRRWRGGLPFDFLVALVYTLLHTMVLFYHAVALNIALNSHSNLLITLLVSNNFVELKSNVFKKCERENLFQVACADVVERFQLSVYLSLVALQFLFVQKVEASFAEWLELGVSFTMIYASELAVDWIKHAFVIKFNRIDPSVYAAFIALLCNDTRRSAGGGGDGPQQAKGAKFAGAAAAVRAEPRPGESPRDGSPSVPAPAPSTAASDGATLSAKRPPPPTPHPGAPSRHRAAGGAPHADAGECSAAAAARMGFVPLPLLCLVIRVVGHDVAPRLYFGHPSGLILCVLVWFVLCFVKVLTSITLLGFACTRPDYAGADGGTAFLAGIERYTLHGKRVM